MSDDFYCEEALSGRTPIDVVAESDDVLAFHHTRPTWPVHIVVVPKSDLNVEEFSIILPKGAFKSGGPG